MANIILLMVNGLKVVNNIEFFAIPRYKVQKNNIEFSFVTAGRYIEIDSSKIKRIFNVSNKVKNELPTSTRSD